MVVRFFRLVALVAFVSGTLPAPVHADPVTVRTGGYSFDTGDPYSLNLVGDDFRFSFDGFDAVTFLTMGPQICHPVGCAAGSIINLSTSLTNISGRPDAIEGVVREVANGIPYSDILLTGELNFIVAPTPVAPLVANRSIVLAPFSFTGHITAIAGTTTVFDNDLTGAGQVRLSLGPSCLDPQCTSFGDPLRFQGIGYTFQDTAPTPEPPTLLLLAMSAGVILRRVRRDLAGR